VLFLAGRLGLRVAEVPVRAEPRDGSKVTLASALPATGAGPPST
jgi:hypothetical protein